MAIGRWCDVTHFLGLCVDLLLHMILAATGTHGEHRAATCPPGRRYCPPCLSCRCSPPDTRCALVWLDSITVALRHIRMAHTARFLFAHNSLELTFDAPLAQASVSADLAAIQLVLNDTSSADNTPTSVSASPPVEAVVTESLGTIHLTLPVAAHDLFFRAMLRLGPNSTQASLVVPSTSILLNGTVLLDGDTQVNLVLDGAIPCLTMRV